MNIVNKLTLRHLWLNRGRTAITVTGIILSVAMVCCVAGFVMSVRDLLMRTIKENNGDYHVMFAGVTEGTADAIISEDVFVAPGRLTESEDGDGLHDLFLRLKHPRRDIADVVGAVAEKYGVTAWTINSELLALEGVFPQSNVLRTFIVIAGIAILIIIAGSVTVIANAFYISSSERKIQFALLKSAGATGGQLRRSVLFEAVLLALIAVPLGVLIGFLIQFAVLRLTNGLLTEVSALNSGNMEFRVIISPAVAVFASAVAVFTLLLSAWRPARRSSAISPIDALRGTKDISDSSGKELRTPRIMGRVFGFEGVLAAKTLKRNRGKYRAAVIGLTMSVVLFVSMASFVATIQKGVEMEYGGYDFDVSIFVHGKLAPSDEADAVFRSIPGAEIGMSRTMFVGTRVPDGFVTEGAESPETSESGYGMILHSMPDEEISRYLPVSGDGLVGILVNNAMFTREGRRLETTPWRAEIGTELPFGYATSGLPGTGSVTIGAVVTEIPGEIPTVLYDGSLINMYIPESSYRDLFTDSPNNQTAYAVKADDPDAFCAAAAELLSPVIFGGEGGGYGINNITQTTRIYRNITLIVMLFGYGFIAMLSLIAVTSVVTTISTGMALRRREFAMLYSIGMTPEGMNRMLYFESLLYGVKSLFVGLPVSAALSYLIHLGMSGTFQFTFRLPIAAMVIGSAAVMLLTFATMRYGKKKLRKFSIVETVRSETA